MNDDVRRVLPGGTQPPAVVPGRIFAAAARAVTVIEALLCWLDLVNRAPVPS